MAARCEPIDPTFSPEKYKEAIKPSPICNSSSPAADLAKNRVPQKKPTPEHTKTAGPLARFSIDIYQV